jgi:hypothetical protein
VAFVHLVWLSVSGWKAVLKFWEVPRAIIICFQKRDVNSNPLSEIILLGSPWAHTMCSRNSSAKSFGPIVSLHITKWAILVRQSTITDKVLHPSTSGGPMIKSMYIESYGCEGSCRGHNSPKGACRIGLIGLQVS